MISAVPDSAGLPIKNTPVDKGVLRAKNLDAAQLVAFFNISDTFIRRTTPTPPPTVPPTGVWAAFKGRIAPAVELAGKGLDKLSEAAQWAYDQVVTLKNDLLDAKEDIANQSQIVKDRLRELEASGQGNSLEALSLRGLLTRLDEMDKTVQSKLHRLKEIEKEIEGGVSNERLQALLKERQEIENELKVVQGDIAKIKKILTARAENAEPGTEDAALIIKGFFKLLKLEAKVVLSAEWSRRINDDVLKLLAKLPPETREIVAKYLGQSYITCNEILGSAEDVQRETAALAPKIRVLAAGGDAEVRENGATVIELTQTMGSSVAGAKNELAKSAGNYVTATKSLTITVDINILAAVLAISISQGGSSAGKVTSQIENTQNISRTAEVQSRSFTQRINDIFRRISKAIMAKLEHDISTEKQKQAEATEKTESKNRARRKAVIAKDEEKNLMHKIYSVIAELFKNNPTIGNEQAYRSSVARMIWLYIFGDGARSKKV